MMREKHLHEKILDILFIHSKDEPIQLTIGEIFWKITSKNVTERKVEEALLWMQKQNMVVKYVNKYAIDKITYLQMSENNGDSTAITKEFELNQNDFNKKEIIASEKHPEVLTINNVEMHENTQKQHLSFSKEDVNVIKDIYNNIKEENNIFNIHLQAVNNSLNSLNRIVLKQTEAIKLIKKNNEENKRQLLYMKEEFNKKLSKQYTLFQKSEHELLQKSKQLKKTKSELENLSEKNIFRQKKNGNLLKFLILLILGLLFYLIYLYLNKTFFSH